MPTVPGTLRSAAHAYPDRPALTFEGHTTTYGEFDAKVDQVTAELIARGVTPGSPKSASVEIEHVITDTGQGSSLLGGTVPYRSAGVSTIDETSSCSTL